MTRAIFVSGTDTGVGKTRVATLLLRALRAGGARAVGMKPVAAGISAGAACSEDVQALRAASNGDAALQDVNPYAFAPAIAPHLAAAQAQAAIDLDVIAAAYRRLWAHADAVVVEGAGGVLVPLGAKTDMLDIPARLRLSVLLVVGVRLGCLNHALLSAQAVSARGLVLSGWIANRIDPAMVAADANVAALVDRLAAPLVADLPWVEAKGTAPTLPMGALNVLGLER